MRMEGGMQEERVREREKMMYRFTQIIQQVVQLNNRVWGLCPQLFTPLLL